MPWFPNLTFSFPLRIGYPANGTPLGHEILLSARKSSKPVRLALTVAAFPVLTTFLALGSARKNFLPLPRSKLIDLGSKQTTKNETETNHIIIIFFSGLWSE